MRKYFFKVIAVIAVTGLISNGAMAQQDTEKGNTTEKEDIIITKKGNKDTKLTVEIKNGEVTINGKPLSEFKDDNVDISRRKTDLIVRGFRSNSPFRSSANSFGQLDSLHYNLENMKMRLNGMAFNSNKAVLGVTFENADHENNGARVRSVIKGSAAEKAGLKENDVITKVNETVITNPEGLTKAISKFNPEDKTMITYKRDNKELKANVTLGKGKDAGMFYDNSNNLARSFNFDMINPQMEALGLARSGSPRLGIKAQDTEEGKGVKVLHVDEESNAEKAGVKEGDIITEFDGKAVTSANELANAARDAKDKNNIKVRLTRSGKSQELEIKVPKKLRTANL